MAIGDMATDDMATADMAADDGAADGVTAADIAADDVETEHVPGADLGMVCVFCGHDRRGVITGFRMTHGIVVWLCPVHGAPRFFRRRNGNVFVRRLEAIWRAGGSFTKRQAAALAHHRRRMTGPQTADLPGSYSWPDLREEAERRWAAGENAMPVIRELRARFSFAPARVPSVRTMQRWFAEGRWHTRPRPRPTFLGIRRPLRSEWAEALPFDRPYHLLLDLWWVEDRGPAGRAIFRE